MRRLLNVEKAVLTAMRCMLGVAFLGLQLSTAVQADEVSPREAEEIMPGRLTLGVRGGNDEVEGLGDLLIPLRYQDGGLLFFNPRVGVNDDSEQEVQMGLGYRYLLPEREMILGANVFYDSRWSRNNNRYDQVGFGVEMFTRYLDARANYYLPERTKRVVERFEQETVSRSSRTTVSTPFPEDHAFKERMTTTTSTTTHREMFEHFETTARGWDVEAGVWMPFEEEYPVQVGVFAGWYRFKPHYGGDVVEGWRGRAELRVLPSLIIDAELYENDRLTGTDYFVGARVQVPFDVAALAHGRNPFAGARDGFRSESRPFAHRLTENVIRDPNIRMGEDIEKVGEETTTRHQSTTRKKTLMDDIMFVDNASAPDGDGTARRPYNTVQDGVDNAFGAQNVYVFAGAGAYQETVELISGVRLLGEGAPIVGSTGKTFGGSRYPLINGGGAGPTITMANDTVVRGFRIINRAGGIPFGDGIYSSTGDGLLIADNIIHSTMHGVHLDVLGDVNVAMVDNLLLNNTIAGALFEGTGASGTFNGYVAGNTFAWNDGDGLRVEALNYDFVNLWLLDNGFIGNEAGGLGANLSGAEAVRVRARDNTARGNAARGLTFLVQDSGAVDFLMEGTTSFGNGTDNVLFNGMNLNGPVSLFADNPVGGMDVVLQQVTANGSAGDGIELIIRAWNGNALVLLDEVDALGNAGNGIALDVMARDGITFVADTVATSGNGGNGILATLRSLDAITSVMEEGTANGNGGAGIDLAARSLFADVVLVMNDASASGNGGAGILASLQALDNVILILDEVMADGNGGTGIGLDARSGAGQVTLILDTSSASGNGGGGIGIDLEAHEDVTIILDGVTAENNGGPGLGMAARSMIGDVVFIGQNVSAGGNGAGGIVGDLQAYEDVTVILVMVTANGNAGAGVGIGAVAESGTAIMILDDVEASGNTDHGFSLDALAWGDAVTILVDPTANDNGGYGLFLSASSLSGSVITIQVSPTFMNNALGPSLIVTNP